MMRHTTYDLRFAAGALALLACAVTPPSSTTAAVTYSFVCDEPTCDGDATLGASFSFGYANAAAAANQFTNSDNPLFLGWTASTSFNGGWSTSGSTFLFGVTAVPFEFNSDGTEIEFLGGAFGTLQFGLDNANRIGIQQGFSHGANLIVAGGSADGSLPSGIIRGQFILQTDPVEIPEPATLAHLAIGLLGLAAARRRRDAR